MYYYKKHYPQPAPQKYLNILQLYGFIRTLVVSVLGYYVVPFYYLAEGPNTTDVFLLFVSFQWYYSIYECISIVSCSLADIFSSKKYDRDYRGRKLVRYYYDFDNSTLFTPWALPILQVSTTSRVSSLCSIIFIFFFFLFIQALVFPAMFFSWFLRASFRYDHRPKLDKNYPK